MPWRMGVALYKAHGQDEYLKKVFAQGESEYRKRKLEEALRHLWEHSKPIAIPATAQTAATTITIAPEDANDPLSDEREDPYRELWLPHYIEMNSLRHKLRYLPNDEERGKAAFRIIYLEELCESYWVKRDHYRKTGQHLQDAVQEPANPVVTDISQLERKLANARSNVSRLKKTPEKKAAIEKWTKEVKKLEAQLPRLAKKR